MEKADGRNMWRERERERERERIKVNKIKFKQFESGWIANKLVAR